ncbi:MAG: AlpA family phage regulatory protein [Methylotenera sp.]|uniref:helix-turn-helix transcriptional regulator n=1 Tax=Methylotenera sp. TaxID=2051956 RepID=UPI002722ADCF|nr:AlpA family phage regulatory protein [Methylotenera sp.]MDO9151677.1 AlpA family phage regulatory protein [Methylotenera sp.]
MQQLKNELTQNIPPALINFDSMPDSAYIRLPVIKALYGVSSATIWRNVKNGAIPKPSKLSERCTAWNVGQVRADLAAKAV